MKLGPPIALSAALLGGAFALTPFREQLSPRDFAGDDNFAPIAGYALHYNDDGPRDGPAVVLLHGFGAWSFTWRIQRAALLAAGFRVVTIDQLGSGASQRVDEPIYTTDLQATLMLGVMDSLGVAQAQLVGHSYGGRVAMRMALDAPERVTSLVLIDPEAFATERPPIAQALQVPLFGYALAFYSTTPALVRTGLKLVTRQHAWLTNDVVAGYAAPLYVQGSAAAQLWQARSPKDGPQPVPGQLAAITQRALIIWGSDDTVFPISDGTRLAATMPHARLHSVAGAGHLPHEEAPDATTQAMLTFLGEGT